jgi:hypothetical protein
VAIGLLEITALIDSGRFAARIAAMFDPRPEIRMTIERISDMQKSLRDGLFQTFSAGNARPV